MTVGEERLRLGEQRKEIFRNFANGVPKEILAEEYLRSVEEIGRELMFVLKKIHEYRHQRTLRPHPDQGMLPPVECSTELDILVNRRPLLWTLDFIGPVTLSTELLIPRLTIQKVEPRFEHVFEAARAVRTNPRVVK